MTITIRGGDEFDDDQLAPPKKKKKKNRQEINKEYFIPYHPPDFKREQG